MTSSEAVPPSILQLAGHPVRWRLLGALAESDRLVHELTALVAEPQNLVSYHLAKLRRERLVFARRSDADRRDTYYGVDLERMATLLSAAGRALHPGLRLAPQPAPEAAPHARVLFLCTGNSARSQMAEGLLRAMSGGQVAAFSAGSAPRSIHPNAVRVMLEDHGVDLGAHAAKHLDVYADGRFDRVVSLCDRVREVCPEFPGHPKAIHWSIANPSTGAPDNATLPLFRQTAADLATRVRFLLAELGDRA